MPGLSTRITANLTPLENTIVYFGDFEEQVEQIAERTVAQVRPFLLNELRFVPSRLPVLPFIWSTNPAANNRARRWYFQNKVDPRTSGGRYQRTGQLGRSWRVRYSDGSMRVSTDYPGARYVVGSLSQDRNRAMRWQVPSHRVTGWPLAADTVNFWFDVYRQTLIENVVRDIGAVAEGRPRRRTYTSPRGRR